MNGLDVGEERKTSYICWDWNPVSSSPYPRHCTGYAIPVARKLVRRCATYLYYAVAIVRRNVANGYIAFCEVRGYNFNVAVPCFCQSSYFCKNSRIFYVV